jgi:hypothetical protein
MRTRIPINEFPYRCNLGDGCPNLFTFPASDRHYCVFRGRRFTDIAINNSKCQHDIIAVLDSLVLRNDDHDA